MNKMLSSVRIEEIKDEFKKEYYKWAVTREIIDVTHYSKVSPYVSVVDEEFIRIGYSHIIPRAFFIESIGNTYYDHKGIGSNYGKGLAFGEINYVLNNFIKKYSEETKIDKSVIINILNGIDKLYYGGDLVILTSPVNISTYMGIDNFKFQNIGSLWGYYNDMPLYWSPVISKNEYYIFNRNIGKIIIKIDINIDVSDIDESEYDSIIKNIPKFTKKDLKNHIRVKVNEVIKFKFKKENTPIIMRLKYDE